MAKEQFIEDLKDNDSVDSLFSVKYTKPPRSYRKGHFFILGLADRTGEMELKYWGGENEDYVRRIYEGIETGDVIRVKGKVSTFREREQIDVEEGEGMIRKAEDYSIEDFVPSVGKDIEGMVEELREQVERMEDPDYRNLLEAFLNDEEFLESFRRAPASMYYHHAYIGGLLEHVLSMMDIVRTVGESYPQLDLDLMKLGCFIHDIGKLEEFDVTTNIQQSERGLLRGHISLGEEILAERIREVGIDEEKRHKIHHVLLSHHGENEHGSPKEPMFAEAAAVHYADDLDSKIFQYNDLRENADTDDWHTYTKRFGQLYLK